MSDSLAVDATTDADHMAFLAKRRAARRVKSRKWRAAGARGAGGAQEPAGVNADMDSLPSKNLSQKGVEVQPVAPRDSALSANPVADVLLEEHTGISYKETPCLVYARPLNPRLLLVQFDDGSRGKVVIRPQERVLFGPGKRIWVKAEGHGLYVLVGRYNRFGVRV